MKSLIIIAALSITTIAMANTNTKEVKKTETLSLEQIAKKAQSTETILGQNTDELTNAQVNDTNRLNTKEAALNTNTNSAKK